MSGILRFWFAPVLLLFGGMLLAAVVDSDDAVDLPHKFYQYDNGKGARGYDVVAYFDESAAVRGDNKIQAKYGGQVWLFSNKENRDKFLETPQKYIPQYGGHCAWAAGSGDGYSAFGDPKAWTIHTDGKLYFNFSKNIRKGWLARVNTDENAIARSDENWRRFVTTGSFNKN